MSYLICALIVIAAWHWVYESVLAPSLRQALQFELESLRRAMRELRQSGRDPHAEALSECVDAVGATFETFDVVTVAAVKRELHRNPLLRARIEARRRLLEGTENAALQSIRRRAVRLAHKALAVNSGAWCIFVIPVAMLRLGMMGIGRAISTSMLLSGAELRRIARAG